MHFQVVLYAHDCSCVVLRHTIHKLKALSIKCDHIELIFSLLAIIMWIIDLVSQNEIKKLCTCTDKLKQFQRFELLIIARQASFLVVKMICIFMIF